VTEPQEGAIMYDITQRFPDDLFPEEVVFVRVATTAEREDFNLEANQPHYVILNLTGERQVIVEGAPRFAFSFAVTQGATPIWMH